MKVNNLSINKIMKLQDLKLHEASYPGNIGMMEMFEFYKKASKIEKDHMQGLLDKKQFNQAWEFLQKVTGVKLT